MEMDEMVAKLKKVDPKDVFGLWMDLDEDGIPLLHGDIFKGKGEKGDVIASYTFRYEGDKKWTQTYKDIREVI